MEGLIAELPPIGHPNPSKVFQLYTCILYVYNGKTGAVSQCFA